MNRLFLTIISLCLIVASSLSAQPVTNNKELKANLALLKKDTAYKQYQEKLSAIMKTAKGRKTNFSAVKTLFAQNKTMLDGLQKQYAIPQYEGTATVKKPETLPQVLPNPKTMTSTIKVYTGPFTSAALYADSTMPWEITQSTNKITWTSDDPANQYDDLGWAAFYFMKTIDVLDDPKIVAVRVEFDYSYYLTGWGTYGGIVPIVGIYSDQFSNSVAYNDLGETNILVTKNGDEQYKGAEIIGGVSFQHRISDYVFSKTSSFTVYCHVTPGKSFPVRLAAGYGPGGVGNLGCYHYGEFELKKITVRYLRADQL